MNPQIPIEARQTVLDFIVAGTSFTAYEVTLEVRRRLGASIDVPHGAVNGIVQTMFANGEIIGYDRRADQTVQSATPPFRYYQIGGPVVAPFVAPTAPAIARSGLPAALQFSDPFGAMTRNLGIAARNFQRAAGKADEPFAVWLPSSKEPTFRLRCYGAGWDENAIEKRFALDIKSAGDADLLWLSAFAYTDKFRLLSNLNGTQTQFLVAMDAALQTRVTKEAERATGEPDGLEIEIAIRAREVSGAERVLQNYRYLRVAPRVYRDGAVVQIAASGIISEGNGWKLTDNRGPVAIVDEIAYSLFGLDLIAGLGVELMLEDAEFEPSRERLVQSERTRNERKKVIDALKSEIAAPIQKRIESADNLWDAKILWTEIIGNTASGQALQRLIGKAVEWRGITIDSGNFYWYNAPGGVKVRQYVPSSQSNKTLDSMTVYSVAAHPETLIFINDLGWSKSASSRLSELYRAAPFKAAYVFAFEDEAARVAFFDDQNFDAVPTRLISELPKPARAASAPRARVARPFDAQLHQPKAPAPPIMASFAEGNDGSDDDFIELKKWARQTPLDNHSWPDSKRLYKAIEARLWPPMGRFRWDKTEADFPVTPIASERDLELLGVLMGRLDEYNAPRDSVAPATPPQTLAQRALTAVSNLVGRAPIQQTAMPGGPSGATLAYMKRRATRLLTFLRDGETLSAERRDALAPLVCGLMQRDQCASIEATLVARLKLAQTDVLANHPEAIARVWADVNLPFNIARWSYNWLESRGQNIAVSPAQLQRFVEWGDGDWTLKLAPAALQGDQSWPTDFSLKKFSQILQGNLKSDDFAVRALNREFLQRRDEIIVLFARFPQLKLDKSWLRDSLREVSDQLTLDWLSPWLNERAQHGEFTLIEKMSPALQDRFNVAIVACNPNGFSLEKWRELSEAPALLQALEPALRVLPVSSEIVNFIWALLAHRRAPILRALGENPSLTPIIEERARQLDWEFIAPLAPSQWERFARVVAATFPSGVGASDWAKIAELPFESGHDLLPLSANFWSFFLPLESAARDLWIARVGVQRATSDFALQDADIFEQLLDSDATGLDALGDAWLEANLSEIPLDGELIIKLAQNQISDWQARALGHLQRAELRLPVALRLMESELPILERVAAPFFSGENPNWSDRVLALADSPRLAARTLALQLLEEFPARWTPDLLRNLAQHDDIGVQGFVAAQLQKAPAEIVESKAVEAFDSAIINARGRARRAKNSVQTRLASEGKFDRATLLEAARNGAPRDREWALQQLVTASLAGAEVDELNVEGAFAQVSESR